MLLADGARTPYDAAPACSRRSRLRRHCHDLGRGGGVHERQEHRAADGLGGTRGLVFAGHRAGENTGADSPDGR
jgi:hypothetical protein